MFQYENELLRRFFLNAAKSTYSALFDKAMLQYASYLIFVTKFSMLLKQSFFQLKSSITTFMSCKMSKKVWKTREFY